MKEALEKVRLLDFLDGQKGLETGLDEQGNNFSGGQRQRLAIARALLHNTPMYILDEAASNIDVESEDQIMEVVRELAKTKTVLFISHRLANVTASDCIYMMENGICAIFLTVLAGMGILKLSGFLDGFSLPVLFAVLGTAAVLRGVLHYGEQACNHYIAFKLLALIRHQVFASLRRLCPAVVWMRRSSTAAVKSS